jgi:tryptophanyl-tRNA synthetase
MQVSRCRCGGPIKSSISNREADDMAWCPLKTSSSRPSTPSLTEPRERYRELMADRRQIDRVLLAGAERAPPEAAALITRTREAIGRAELRT